MDEFVCLVDTRRCAGRIVWFGSALHASQVRRHFGHLVRCAVPQVVDLLRPVHHFLLPCRLERVPPRQVQHLGTPDHLRVGRNAATLIQGRLEEEEEIAVSERSRGGRGRRHRSEVQEGKGKRRGRGMREDVRPHRRVPSADAETGGACVGVLRSQRTRTRTAGRRGRRQGRVSRWAATRREEAREGRTRRTSEGQRGWRGEAEAKERERRVETRRACAWGGDCAIPSSTSACLESVPTASTTVPITAMRSRPPTAPALSRTSSPRAP
ncbi:hypothetical protein DMC30DRAFT_394804 [Rhodotorula diobovata]|uniref:Uncharacterized protein n=1 Tax=Rhodotorula diobovata TaxID=5288 RepID=A0A5C5FX72_9BASI|nr:hypothetical protein DMC30DRAFT_394804 [Rhodotorula diobovata]